MSGDKISSMQRIVKLSMDFVLAALALMMATPLLIAIAIAVKSSSSGPIFFRQVRLGLNGAPFQILKFRTMHPGAEELAPRDEERATIVSARYPGVTSVGS